MNCGGIGKKFRTWRLANSSRSFLSVDKESAGKPITDCIKQRRLQIAVRRNIFSHYCKKLPGQSRQSFVRSPTSIRYHGTLGLRAATALAQKFMKISCWSEHLKQAEVGSWI